MIINKIKRVLIFSAILIFGAFQILNAQYDFEDFQDIKNQVEQLNVFYKNHTGPFIQSLDSILKYDQYFDGDSSINKIERFQYNSIGLCEKREIEFYYGTITTLGLILQYNYDQQNRIDTITLYETENGNIIEQYYRIYTFQYDNQNRMIELQYFNHTIWGLNHVYIERNYHGLTGRIDSTKSFLFDPNILYETPNKILVYNYDSIGRIESKIESNLNPAFSIGETNRILYYYMGDSITEIYSQFYNGQWNPDKKNIYIKNSEKTIEKLYHWSSEYNHWFRTITKIRLIDSQGILIERIDSVYMDPSNITYNSVLSMMYQYDEKGNLVNIEQMTTMSGSGDTLYYSYPSFIDTSISYQFIKHIPFFPSGGEVNTKDKLLSYHTYLFGLTQDILQNRISDFCFYSIILENEDLIPSFISKIYPNPTNDIFYLELPDKVYSGDLSIFTVYGEKIKSSKFYKEDNPISLINMPNGIYIGIFKNKKDIYKFKITKI